MKRIFTILLVALWAEVSLNAVNIIAVNDTAKAVKIAKKAQKLIASGKVDDAAKAKELYEQAADMGLHSAMRWMADYNWKQNPPMVKTAMWWEGALAQQGDTTSQYLLGYIYLGMDDGQLGIETDYAKGVEYMKMAAEQGMTDAQAYYGVCLTHGIGVEQNCEQALQWNLKAAEKGNVKAQSYVGNAYLNGNGCTIDYKKALVYTTKAAEQGDADSQFNLGVLYQNGMGVQKNLDEAIYWYTKASEQGSAGAKNNLAVAMEEKNGASSNNSEYLIEKAANEGDEMAQYNLGNKYAGQTPPDYQQAFIWYQKSADKGCAPGERQLGLAYLNGNGVDKDVSKGFYWISKAADQKDTVAVNVLGACYEDGLGVAANPQMAFMYYQKAVDVGFTYALYNVARCYYSGIGVEQSYINAFEWAKKACEKNIREAYYMVGHSYQTAEGTDKDLYSAIKYYQKTSELSEDGNEVVYFQIALCYKELSNSAKTIEYYKKAADLGSPRAQYNLALCYCNGDGVTLNMEKCKSLLRKCANQNNDDEAKKLAKEALKLIK